MSREKLDFDVDKEMKHLKKISNKDDSLTISSRFVKYLIEQTERVKQLEETVEDYKAVNKELHQRGRKVRKQNKRYREALEFYADEDNYKTTGEKTYIGHGDYTEEIWIPVDVDSGKKARQALEGEE